MREIKFRLRLNNKMVGYEKWYSGSNKDGNWVAKPQWLYSVNRKNWSPRYIFHNAKDLFTGLHDKNGKEIYEGDIADIRYTGGGHTKDMFTPCVCVFGTPDLTCYDRTVFMEIYPMFYFKQIAIPNCFPLNGNEEKGVEVIGNIYENPELLEGDNAAN